MAEASKLIWKTGTVASICTVLVVLCGFGYGVAHAATSAEDQAKDNKTELEDQDKRIRDCEVNDGRIEGKFDTIIKILESLKPTP